MSPGAADARIRELRPARLPVDPWQPQDVVREPERTVDGVRETLTIFLTGSECPFTCVFCDLWRYTLETPTPAGAIPAQIEQGVAEVGEAPAECRVKLYNASNFFDGRAVPPADLPRIAEQLLAFERVVVECHPRLVGETVFEFASRLDGRLEVAMGLETAHPEALLRLNKRMTQEEYDRAAELLAGHEIPHRSFVLVGAPFVPERDSVDWTVVSAAYAMDRGAELVTLIPVRRGNGELERLEETGAFWQPSLADAESAIARSLLLPEVQSGESVVQLDLWDLERFTDCPPCFEERRLRLERMNLTGASEPPVECGECGGDRP